MDKLLSFVHVRTHYNLDRLMQIWELHDFAVGAQKFAGICLIKSNRWQSSGFSANALGTRMNLFERFARVIKVINEFIFNISVVRFVYSLQRCYALLTSSLYIFIS